VVSGVKLQALNEVDFSYFACQFSMWILSWINIAMLFNIIVMRKDISIVFSKDIRQF